MNHQRRRSDVNNDFTAKEMLVTLMDKMDDVIVTQTEYKVHIEAIREHTSETNGKVAEAIKDIARVDKKIETEDAKVVTRLLKYGGSALVVCTFVFVKESRDIILALF